MGYEQLVSLRQLKRASQLGSILHSKEQSWLGAARGQLCPRHWAALWGWKQGVAPWVGVTFRPHDRNQGQIQTRMPGKGCGDRHGPRPSWTSTRVGTMIRQDKVMIWLGMAFCSPAGAGTDGTGAG